MKACTLSFLLCLMLFGWACAHEQPSRYPPRQEGCDVRLFREAPPFPTENLGPVVASCSQDVPDEDCLRTLKDEACKLGGDVIWGVNAAPQLKNGRNVWKGRAAHSQAK